MYDITSDKKDSFNHSIVL